MVATAEAVRPRMTAENGDANDRSRQSSALGLIVAGLAVLALAGGLLATVPHPRKPPSAAPSAAPASPTSATSDGLTIQSPGDITVLNMTYAPGQSSGWHHHRGIHAVAVISGELTVYDQDCVAHTYGAGDAYIGGQLPHLVRNEGTEPATMVVTYFNPTGPTPATVAPSPPPCDAR